MNAWYARYPGDYRRDTAHLTLPQHGAYVLLLDHYYSTAAPLPTDLEALRRICSASDETERKAVDFIVSQFFELRADGYHNARADKELAKRAEHHERLSDAGRKRWQKPASSQAPSQAIAGPQPQPQPQPQRHPQEPQDRLFRSSTKNNATKGEIAPPGLVPVTLWLSFVEMRKKERHPLTPHAGELIRRKLQQLKNDGEDPVEVLEQSIRNGWRDVFAVRKENGNGNHESFHERRSRKTAEAIRSVVEGLRETTRASERALPAADLEVIHDRVRPGPAKPDA